MYAVVRFLHHAGKLGIVDENLWKTSNQQLRDMLADRIGPNARYNGKTSDSIREPKEWLSNLEILTLDLLHN
ncbi:hypothetical protein AGMMS49990_01220 [Endomicrobiia bacterium]|nr:hypothetical protein AGMMS49990_01220 [Endomicrobiia bacterium]